MANQLESSIARGRAAIRRMNDAHTRLVATGLCWDLYCLAAGEALLVDIKRLGGSKVLNMAWDYLRTISGGERSDPRRFRFTARKDGFVAVERCW